MTAPVLRALFVLLLPVLSWAAGVQTRPVVSRAHTIAGQLGGLHYEAAPTGPALTLGAPLSAGPLALAPSAVAAAMNAQGFDLVPLASPAELTAINAEIDARRMSAELYDLPRGFKRASAMNDLIERATKLIQDALPDEDIQLRDANLRVHDRHAHHDNLHVDAAYVTVTLTLKGPGTLIYTDDLKELEAPLGTAAIITNLDRWRATGVKGTVHSSPNVERYQDDDRRILILRYARKDQPKATPEEAQALGKRALTRIAAAASKYRSAKAGRAPPKKTFFGLFGD